MLFPSHAYTLPPATKTHGLQCQPRPDSGQSHVKTVWAAARNKKNLCGNLTRPTVSTTGRDRKAGVVGPSNKHEF